MPALAGDSREERTDPGRRVVTARTMTGEKNIREYTDRDLRANGTMFAEERQRGIIERLRQHGKITVDPCP